jgi:hypothetical protein
MCLIFIEYLEQKSKKDKPEYLKSGSGNIVPHLKKYSAYFFVGVGALSGLITIKNEYISKANYDKLHEEWKKSKESAAAELKQVEDKLVLNNMYTRINYTSLDLTFQELKGIRTKKSELMKSVEADLENWTKTGDDSWEVKARIKKLQLKLLESKESRVEKELEQSIESGRKYSQEISQEPDDQKVLDKINEEINKSSIFGLDIEKLLTELWDNFETFDGITKLVFVMLLSNSLILWCVVSIILNKYSNYLLDRFNLETKFPRIAIFIKLRKKMSVYYMWSNFLIIILVCLTDIILGLSILSLFFSLP